MLSRNRFPGGGAPTRLLGRRAFLSLSLLGAAGCGGAGDVLVGDSAATRHPGRVDPEYPRAPGPFGWPTVGIGPDRDLRIAASGAPPAPASFRLVLARGCRSNAVLVGTSSGTPLGVMPIRAAFAMQSFELPLDASQVAAAAREGLILRTTGAEPLVIFSESPDSPGIPPHLLSAGAEDPWAALRRHLGSAEAFQPSGWMIGCVLDALWDLGASRGQAPESADLRRHLDRFLGDTPEQRRTGRPTGGIEGTLPAAVLARIDPGHAWIDRCLKLWRERRDVEGCIQDGSTTSCEGSYTVAYPLAVVGRVRNEPALQEEAVRQLVFRKRRLAVGDDIFLRWIRDPGGNRHYMRNWSRGIAWYALGLVRTLLELPEALRPADLLDEVRRLPGLLLPRRDSSGLWACYAGEPATGLESSGSAGIAAAFVLAANAGWIDASFRNAARRTLAGLRPHLRPDGQLGLVTQSNSAGEELQRSGYRVLASFGAGLAGQLLAALG